MLHIFGAENESDSFWSVMTPLMAAVQMSCWRKDLETETFSKSKNLIVFVTGMACLDGHVMTTLNNGLHRLDLSRY